MNKQMNFLAENQDNNLRIDLFLSNKTEDYSRSFIKQLILDGYVKVNKVKVKPSYKIQSGDKIEMITPSMKKITIEPEDIPLEIVYEDDAIMIVNKKQGMVVHPATGNYTKTLVNALLYYTKDLSKINGELRPGIVHRIDKDTSGLLMVAKNDLAHESLARQLKAHTITRKYLALTEGIIKEDNGRIYAPIGRHPVDRKKMSVVDKNGKKAITHFNVMERFEKNTLIEAQLETGRTHQIRVHLSYIGHPLVGDPLYGYQKQKFNLKGQLLHAKVIGFIHPIKNIYMEFESDLPEYFTRIINILRVK